MPRRELCVGRDPAFVLGVHKGPLAVGVPAVVELARVLVRPFLCDLVRTVDCAGCPIHIEGFVRLNRVLSLQPADCVISEIFGEVIALLRRPGRQDAGRVAHQVRLVLRGFAAKETVEVLEPQPRRPVLERPGDCRLVRGRVVPLAERGRGVAVIFEHLGLQGTAPGNQTRIAIPVVGQLSDLACSDAVMIAAGQQ